MYDPKKIGNRIRAHRVNLNISIDSFSNLLHITSNYLRSIESGANTPSIALAVEICNLFHVSADYLLCGGKNSVPGRANKESKMFENFNRGQLVSMLNLIEKLK